MSKQQIEQTIEKYQQVLNNLVCLNQGENCPWVAVADFKGDALGLNITSKDCADKEEKHTWAFETIDEMVTYTSGMADMYRYFDDLGLQQLKDFGLNGWD